MAINSDRGNTPPDRRCTGRIRAIETAEAISKSVFECSHCERLGLPFVRNAAGKFFRFPPTIGSTEPCPLLFVGINPRVSASNHRLHERIVDNWIAFEALRRNRVGSEPYIANRGLERHYNLHVRVATALFPTKHFESVAAVTELHFCASSSSVGLPQASSVCAERYLRDVFASVRPVVVFAVGSHVERVLLQFGSGHGQSTTVTWSGGSANVVPLPHPNAFGPKREPVERAISQARSLLNAQS